MQKPTKLFIALPVYGAVDPLFTQCLMRVIHGLKVPAAVQWCVGDSLVGRARNRLTREFLASDCTHLLFIDTDLVFSPEHIERIASHDLPVVGGLYCKKQEGHPRLVLNSFNEGSLDADETGLSPVKYIGTGFMCIKREVFEQIAARWPEDSYLADETNDPEYDFWRVGVYHYADGAKRYLSEDWWFCQRVQELGLKVYADPNILCKHHGMACYPLSYQADILYGRLMGSSTESTSATEQSVAEATLTAG